MKKTLRFVMMAICALLYSSSVMAENVIWQEDWSSVTEFKVNPQDFNANYTFTGTVLNDDGSFKSGTTFYNENLAGGTAPELLIAKNGGSFAAKVAVSGVSGETTLAFKCNKKLDVTVSGASIGEATNAGNDYSYPITIAAGTSEITITFTMSSNANARIDNIRLFQGTAKKPAGLSWGKASTTVTLGSTDNLPVLQNSNNLPVTFASSEISVATIAQDGTITLVAAGKTTLTASFEGNDEYEAESVSIEMTVKEGQGGQEEVETITVAKALELIAALADGAKSSDKYLVKGFVVAVTEISTEYGNATFTIADEKGGQNVLTVFRIKGFNGESITNENLLKVGDEVVVEGLLQKYVKNGVTTPELAQGGKIISINGQDSGITDARMEAQQGKVYNLSGQLLAAPKKGINIIAGKKYLVK